jgi:hypothetical protein
LQGKVGDFLVQFHGEKFLAGSIGGLLAAISFDYSRGGRHVSLQKRFVLPKGLFDLWGSWVLIGRGFNRATGQSKTIPGFSPRGGALVFICIPLVAKAAAKTTRFAARQKLCPFKARALKVACLAAFGFIASLPLVAQYPGQVTKKSKDSPELRSIAVLEWTGVAGKPNSSRLVPVAVLDGGELQDGSIYLARPEPMAVASEVEYELLQGGKPLGFYDIRSAGQEQGSWVGYGAWKPVPAAKPKPSMDEVARSKPDYEGDDKPVLHRKRHADDAPGAAGGSDKTAASSEPATPADPDRPTLHKKDSGSSTPNPADDKDGPTLHKPDSSAGSEDAGSSAPSDPDRPTLHKKTPSDDDTSAGTGAQDPDRPKLKKTKSKPAEDVGYEEAIPGVTDPDRPTLKRGKRSGDSVTVAPSLMGLPPEMQQAVAVSDAKSRPEHPWNFSWASPDDEAKMKSALEDMARDALGLKPPPPPPAPKRTTTATHKAARPAPPPPPPAPAPLEGEQFRVFELAYGAGATMVLSAHTGGSFSQQKFVTLIAQPDLYGNIKVLLKSVTDGNHLDDNPRMRLVDAVDAMADNRGELLFELRGDTQRQFAIYRVLRGQAEKLFTGGGGPFGIESRE